MIMQEEDKDTATDEEVSIAKEAESQATSKFEALEEMRSQAADNFVEGVPLTSDSGETECSRNSGGLPDKTTSPDSIEPLANTDLSTSLSKQIATLQTMLETRFTVDGHKDKIIDRLHEELQLYKNDLVSQVLKPVLTDLIRLHDDMSKILRDLKDKPTYEVKDVLRSLESFPDDIVDILSRQGLEPYHADTGTTFDPKIQTVISKVLTSDSSLDKGVAESLRPGFMWGDRIFRRNMIRIHSFQHSEPAAPIENIH